jgi:hypothetical protein
LAGSHRIGKNRLVLSGFPAYGSDVFVFRNLRLAGALLLRGAALGAC